MRRLGLAVLAALLSVVVGSTAQASFEQKRPQPQEMARTLLTQWTVYVRKGARLNPKPQFARARRTAISRVVERNASRFHYLPEGVTVLRGRDGAPLVIVKVDGHLLAFSRSVRALVQRLDPFARVPGPAWHALKYEAFFFEAVDSHGVPFLVTWNAMRDPPRGGGQWARTEALLPFPHG
jgi:hypothetical protein